MKPYEQELSWFRVIQNPLIEMSLKARKEWALLRRDFSSSLKILQTNID